MSGSITICEVAPRDGLQNEEAVLSAATRAQLVTRLARCGLPRIEFGSFVRSDLVPAMADADQVLAKSRVRDDVLLTALVLNTRGAELALDAGVRRLNFAMVCTETFNRRNQGVDIRDSVAAFGVIAERARAAGARCTVTLGASFGCPFEGAVHPQWPVELAAALVGHGADEVVFADTIGVGVPAQVHDVVGRTRNEIGDITLGLHLHDTRNTAIANALAGIQAGVTLLDSALGGAGGCPFAPRATGNVATEDLLYALHQSGIDTGVDLDAVVEQVPWLEEQLGRALPGKVARAGARPLEVTA